MYGKETEGENFEVTEAYWFDPSDYLDEELREMLNNKIKLSVKLWFDKYVSINKECEELKTKLQLLELEASQIAAGIKKSRLDDPVVQTVEKEVFYYFLLQNKQ